MKNATYCLKLFSIFLFLSSCTQTAKTQVEPAQYYLLQAVHSGKYIQLSQNSKDHGVALQQGESSGAPYQQFQLVSTSDGFYKIIIRNSGLVLDIEQSSYDNGARVLQWSYNGTPNQQFEMEPAGQGIYRFKARHSGKYLDVEWSGRNNGARFIQWEYSGNPNQQFRLIPVSKGQAPQSPRPITSNYQQEAQKIRSEIIRGVQKVAAPGTPGPLILSDKKVFPIIVAETGSKVQQTVVAAAYYGQGRIVAFGHGGFFDEPELKIGQTQLLLDNSLKWAANQKQNDIRVGIWGPQHLIGLWNAKQGLTVRTVDQSDWQNGLQNFDVVVVSSGRLSDDKINPLQSFAERGGGLLLADLGWGWQYLNPDKDLMKDNPSNKLLRPVGITWSPNYAPDPAEGYAVHRSVSLLTNTQIALDRLAASGGALNKEEKKQAWFALGQAASLGLQMKAIDDYLESFKKQADFPGGDFPASVPGRTSRISGNLRIPAEALNINEAAWHSTGFYAAPGDVIRVQVDASAVKKGLKVQVGSHSDELWHKERWDRFPSIVRSLSITDTETWISNPFGGLIYITAPANLNLPESWFTFHNVIQSPSFVLGKNSLSDWQNTIRNHPAPWAELVSEKVIITVPSDKLRTVQDPIKLLQFWDKVLDLTADLAVQARDRKRPERIVPDKQISAGYMHSGYPIMTHLDAIDRMLSIDQLQKAWGLYHELGHNHQHRDWTFDGTVEVTCNLFTLYIREKATNTSPRKAFMDQGRRAGPEAFYQEQKNRRPAEKFQKWKSDPFLALAMYIQLQEAFGWETYLKVFKEYSELAENEKPKNDNEKRDQWMVRFSKATGKNLAPFFDDWGVPVSESAKREVARLSTWRP